MYFFIILITLFYYLKMPITIDKHINEEINLKNSKIKFIYKGVMNNEILSVCTRHIENELEEYSNLSRKINRVIIELSQNIAYYSDERIIDREDSRGVGSIMLKEFDDSFQFTATNKINEESFKNLKNKCTFINSCDLSELKNIKSEQRNRAPEFENRCNIGLIQVAILSSDKLLPEIVKEKSDSLYCSLSINFKK